MERQSLRFDVTWWADSWRHDVAKVGCPAGSGPVSEGPSALLVLLACRVAGLPSAVQDSKMTILPRQIDLSYSA